MTARRTTRCDALGATCCQLFWPGHNIHAIHAGKIGASPWGWRDALLTDADSWGFLEVQYGRG